MGEETKREVIRQCIKSYKDMGMNAPKTLPSDGVLEWTGETNLDFYMKELIDPISHATKDFFVKEAQQWNANENCPDYIDLIDTKLQQEDLYVDMWFEVVGGKKVVAAAESQMIS
jgi:hypothetical protein